MSDNGYQIWHLTFSFPNNVDSPPAGTYQPDEPNREVLIHPQAIVGKLVFDLGKFSSGNCLIGFRILNNCEGIIGQGSAKFDTY